MKNRKQFKKVRYTKMKEYTHVYYYGNEPIKEKETKEQYWEQEKLLYMEKIGICEIYSETLKTITYYSYFGSEGFYKITKNLESGKETRNHMKWTKAPKHLLVETTFMGEPFTATKYNYFCG